MNIPDKRWNTQTVLMRAGKPRTANPDGGDLQAVQLNPSSFKSEGVHLMPKELHTTAAYHHERAAKSHRAAAQQSGTGAHESSQQHADAALEHSARADEASKLAHQKSAQHAKPVLVAAK